MPCTWLTTPTFMFARGAVSYPALGVGVHEFKVRATDFDVPPNVGTAAEWAWKVDAPPVQAEVVCGEIIVESIQLTHDLVDCEGNGLIIGRSGITLDLDGHLIDGVGLDSGVLNPGFDNVTVTNGLISEFDYGVQLGAGTGRSVVSDLRLELHQEAGIALADADQPGPNGTAYGNSVRRNELSLNRVGIALYSGTRNAVVRDNAIGGSAWDGVRMEHARGNRIEHNEINGSSGAGVFMQGGRENLVTDNVMEDNKGGVSIGEELIPANDNVVARNAITGHSGGVLVIDSTGNRIEENRIAAEDGTAVMLELARETVIRANNLAGSKGGVEIGESVGNLVEINNASGTLGSGISIEGMSADNDLIRNTASDNSGEGIEVDGMAPAGRGNKLVGNDADGNGGDGIGIFGVGHIVQDNSAQRNGGWGIYAAVGAIDLGGNFAAGNVEPEQCFRVQCATGAVPGEPETWIVEGPPLLSHSRNASFTYNGSDLQSLPHEIVYECRIDTQDPFAWEDCEYPAEWMNLSPGEHVVEIRAIDMSGSGLADSSPARHVWTYQPLPAGDAPEVILDLKPEPQTWIPESIFTFHSNEPDVTFECRVDENATEPCGFDTVADMDRGGFEWGLEETDVGPHTFFVRAIDFEGNVGEWTTYTWHLLGIATEFLPGPNPTSTGFTPAETPFDLATGGETLSTTAVIAFEANMADATFECSLDLQPFEPCTSPVTYENLLPGDHILRVISTAGEVSELEAAEYEWGIVEGIDTAPPETTIERRPAPNSSSTQFEFTGTDDQTPPELLVFECRVDSTNELDWEECTSPFNLLDLYTYEDPQMAPGQHTFEVRAIDLSDPPFENPNNPNFEGNPDPTPASYTWTMTADTIPPSTGITSGPENGAKVGLAAPPDPLTGVPALQFDFVGSDNASPVLALEYECKVDSGPWESVLVAGRAERPRARPAQLRGPRDRPGAQRRRDAGDPHLHRRADAADHDHRRPGHVQPRGHPRQQARDRHVRVPLRPAGLAVRVPARRRPARPAAGHRRVRIVHVADRLLQHPRGRARVRGPRDQPRGRHRGAPGDLGMGRRARARRRPAADDDHQRPARRDGAHGGDLRVRRQRQPRRRRDVRVRARRHRVQLVHLARAVLGPHARHARAARPRP